MEDKIHSQLVDWAINYLKNKDLISRKIELIEKNRDGFDFYIKFKDKEQFFVVDPVIGDIGKILSKFDPERYFGLFVLNTKHNLDILVKNWGEFVKIKNLGIYFVNPFSQLDKKWIIYPYTHNSICEQNALERGLKTMFDMVETLTEEQIKDRFK